MSVSILTKRGNVFEVNSEDFRLNGVVFPYQYNPHNIRPWAIGHAFGVVCVVWASCEQDAFDEMVDANYEQFIVPPDRLAEMSDEEREELVGLGNASELCDLSDAWIDEIVIDHKAEGFRLWVDIAVSLERGADRMVDDAMFNV